MAQAGSVSIGGVAKFGTTSPWSFDIGVRPDTYDLIASDDNGTGSATRVAIRRSLEVFERVDIDPLDLDVEGVALVNLPLTLGNASADESINTSVVLSTNKTDAFMFSGSGLGARVAPQSILVETDRQEVNVSAATSFTSRVVSAFSETLDNDPLALPPRLEGISFGADEELISVSWTELPIAEFDFAMLTASSIDHSVILTATRRWVETTNASFLSLEPDIPKLDPVLLLRHGDALFGTSVKLLGSNETTTRTTTRFRESR